MGNNEAVENRGQVKPKKKRSQWVDIWRRLRRNPVGMIGLAIVVILILTAIFADVISPAIHDPILGTVPSYEFQDLRNRNAFPSSEQFFGTDNFGRSIFDRVIHGSRISLLVGFIVVGISMIVGVALGTIAGYYGGHLESFIMRFSEVLTAVPGMLFIMVMMMTFGQSLFCMIMAMGINSIPVYIRIARASVLRVRGDEFVEAAKATGISNFRIMFTEVLPNAMSPIIVTLTTGIGMTVMTAAGLSFIGFGVRPPAPEWGGMVNSGRSLLRTAPWISLFPGLAIMFLVLSFNMLGDGLRDALDPKLKR